MLDYIKKLQKKSPRQREQITFFVSLGITSIIFVVWITAFAPGLVSSSSQETRSSGAAPPFEQLKRNFGYFVDDFHQTIKRVRDGFEDSFVEKEDLNQNEIFQPRNERAEYEYFVGEEPDQGLKDQKETPEEDTAEEEKDFGEGLIEE